MSWDAMWDESFLNAIANTEERTGTNPVDWRKGGRATKQNPDKEDKAWWDVNGKKMFFDFINAWSESGFDVWITPENVPGVELDLACTFDDVLVKGYADLVAVRGGELCVIDLKTGMYTPESALQLGVYACAMEKLFGVRPSKGYYYSARNAQFIEADGLDRWTIPVLTNLFSKFVIAVDNEIFLPNIGMNCKTCGVAEYCYAVGGQLSQIFDPLSQIK